MCRNSLRFPSLTSAIAAPACQSLWATARSLRSHCHPSSGHHLQIRLRSINFSPFHAINPHLRPLSPPYNQSTISELLHRRLGLRQSSLQQHSGLRSSFTPAREGFSDVLSSSSDVWAEKDFLCFAWSMLSILAEKEMGEERDHWVCGLEWWKEEIEKAVKVLKCWWEIMEVRRRNEEEDEKRERETDRLENDLPS